MIPLRMRWLGTACFEIVLPNGRTLVIDPFVDDAVSAPITSDQFEGCDYLFLTHGHYDHILDAGKLAARFKPVIFCSQLVSESLTHHLGVNSNQIRTVIVGDIVRVDSLTVKIIQGTHVDFRSDYKRLTGKDLQPGMPIEEAVETTLTKTFETDWRPDRIEELMEKFPQGEQLNYVFEPDKGPRIYMAGTRPDPNQIKIAGNVHADITLLQVPPANALKGLEKATADLAIASGCRVCVPQHHDPLLKGAKKTDLSTLESLLSEIQFKELVPGKWYDFDDDLLILQDAYQETNRKVD